MEALHEISFSAEDHQFIGILGPSGCGKSSLFYMLSGMRRLTKGEVCLDDRPYSKMSENERVGLRRTEFGVLYALGIGRRLPPRECTSSG